MIVKEINTDKVHFVTLHKVYLKESIIKNASIDKA